MFNKSFHNYEILCVNLLIVAISVSTVLNNEFMVPNARRYNVVSRVDQGRHKPKEIFCQTSSFNSGSMLNLLKKTMKDLKSKFLFLQCKIV